MRRRGNKVLSIVLIVIAIIAISGGVFAYTFFCTDMLKSSQQLFAKYLVQNLTELSQTATIDKITEIENKLQQNKYEEDVTISYTDTGKVQPNNIITVETQNDPVNKKTYSNIVLEDENIENELQFEYMKDTDTYSLRFTNSVKQFLSIENANLKQLAESMGIDEEIVEIIPDSIDFEEFSLDQLKFTEEEKNTEISKYAMLLYDNIAKENYSKVKDTVITVNGKTITTNAYSLTLTMQDIENLKIKFLETLKQDEIILAKIQTIDEMLQDYDIGSLKEAFLEVIDQNLNQETEELSQETSIKIIIYETDGKTVRTKIEQGLEYLTIDTTEEEGKRQIDINYINIDENNTPESNGIKIIKENDNKLSVELNKIYGEEQQTTKLDLGLEESENSIKLSLSYENEDGQTLLIRNINFVNEINYKVNLNSSNNIVLNELSEEQLTNIFNLLEPTLTEKYSEPMELVDTTKLLPGILALPLQKEEMFALIPVALGITIVNSAADAIQGIDFTDTEILLFNDKFQIYEGTNVSASVVNSLLNTVLTNNLNETELETERYVTVSGDMILKADDTSIIKAEENKYYDVECQIGYDGRVNEIIITESIADLFNTENITSNSTDNITNTAENIINSLNSLN